MKGFMGDGLMPEPSVTDYRWPRVKDISKFVTSHPEEVKSGHVLDIWMDEDRSRYPIRIEPNERIIVRTSTSVKFKGCDFSDDQPIFVDDISYESRELCLETRSGVARRGLAAIGFFDQKTRKLGYSLNEYEGQLHITLKNMTHRPIIIPKPISPAQICLVGTRKLDIDAAKWGGTVVWGTYTVNTGGIKREYNIRVDLDSETHFPPGMPLYLSDELLVLKNGKEIDILGDYEKEFEKESAKEIDRFSFCLGVSREKIMNDQNPCYVFPLHFLDNVPVPKSEKLIDWLGKIFENGDRKYLPVTTNAGVINQGHSGHVVFEICGGGVSKKRIREYFSQENPFGLLIPLLSDHSVRSVEYNGRFKSSEGIKLGHVDFME